MELKDRLSYLMERRGITNAAELSRRSGLTQVAIRNYMRGIKVPNAQALMKLSRALNTTADYILSGTPRRPDRIPLLTEIPERDPSVWPEVLTSAHFGEEYLDRGDITDPLAYALIIDNDAMSPRINTGDIVILSPNAALGSRSIAAASTPGGKRLLRTVITLPGDRILLYPENTRYTPEVHPREEILFLGRVIERREKF